MLVGPITQKYKIGKLVAFIAAPIVLLGVFFVSSQILVNAQSAGTTTAAEDEVGKLNTEIADKKSKIEDLNKDLEVYKKAIAAKQEEALTLKNHISLLDDQIGALEIDIEKNQQEIDATNLEIENLKLEIHIQEDKITDHKQTLEELLRTLYRNDQKTVLDILLENNSFSEYYNQSQYLVSLNSELTKTVQGIEDLKASLQEQKAELESKKTQLSVLQTDLATKKETLVAQKEERSSVLEETQNDEGKFQQLVGDVKSEQDQINSEIANLSETVRKRLEQNSTTGGTPELPKTGTGTLAWPIDSQRVTAEFHDPNYPYRRYFEHPAIDIGTPQGTPVRAADGGVVAIAKKLDWVKNSQGKILYPAYNYILIVHPNGLSTVYGHLSGVSVSEGEIVGKGQTIGRSGALPGTAGAGRLTTGPHLHFEVRLNGIPVNPRDYLP